jgi:hypothetical protein
MVMSFVPIILLVIMGLSLAVIVIVAGREVAKRVR